MNSRVPTALETVLGEGLKEFQRGKGQHSEEEQSHSHMSRFGGASPRTVGKGRTTEFRQLTVEDFHKIKKSMGLSIVQTKVVQHYRRENPDLLKASLSKK